MTATEAKLEVLSTALDAFTRAELAASADPTFDNVRAEIRATNVLVDACVSLGMPHDLPDHVGWAAGRVARWLCAA